MCDQDRKLKIVTALRKRLSVLVLVFKGEKEEWIQQVLFYSRSKQWQNCRNLEISDTMQK